MRSLAWLAVVALAACGYQQSPRTMRACEFVIAGSLVGVLGTSIAAGPATGTTKDVLVDADVSFAALTLTALAVYLVADYYDRPPPSQSAQQRADEQAWELTKRARDAARAGDCDRVKKIAPAVRDKDRGFYDVVFMRDVAIQRCLQPATPPAR
jgi:hypothetical protein